LWHGARGERGEKKIGHEPGVCGSKEPTKQGRQPGKKKNPEETHGRHSPSQ